MKANERICFPADPNPRRPQLRLPPGAWDTHFHVVGPDILYPYDIENQPFCSPAAPVEHYFAVSSILGLERGVVVHPAFHGFDNAVTLDAIQKSDGRFRGVVIDNPAFQDADIVGLHEKGIRGVRFELRNLVAFDESRFMRAIHLLARHNWVALLHVDSDSLIRLADCIAKLPVQTVIENFAQIDARLGLRQPAVRTFADLAAEKHVWLKAASAYRMMARKGSSYEEMVEVARLMCAASPERVTWGTDWPHPGFFEVGQIPDDAAIVETLADIIPNPHHRQMALVDNPARLFD